MKLATKHLSEKGLLALSGAKPCLEGTPGMMGYGMAKAAVHQLTKSLADPAKAGLPPASVALAILPVGEEGEERERDRETDRERVNGRTDGWTDRRRDGQGRMDGQTLSLHYTLSHGGEMDRLMDGQTNRRTDLRTNG